MNEPLTMPEKVPFTLEAEQAVLGSMILDAAAIQTAKELLTPQDFFSESHAVVYDTMISLYSVEMPVDITTLEYVLSEKKTGNSSAPHETWFDRIGRAGLKTLQEAPPTSKNIGHYCKHVKRDAQRRCGMERAEELKALFRDYPDSLERIAQSNGYFDFKALSEVVSKGNSSPFARGIISAESLPHAQDPLRLWFGLYPRSVVLLIGETGAGKSSLLYNFCIHAARNEPLWGIPFGLNRQLRILYVDPENSGNFAEGHGGQCAVKIERIKQGKPKDLIFHDGQGVNLSRADHLHALADYIQGERFDIVVLDPIANLFQTRDENDNAEAARQMTALTSLSRETGACIVPVHHTGKGEGGGNYGRGASARLASADVAMVFRCRGSNEEADDTFTGELIAREDICRLQIVKNRLEGRGSLYVQMAGEDKFILSTFAAWKGRVHSADPNSKKQKAEEEISLLLSDGLPYSRAAILQQLKQEGFGRDAVDSALSALVSDGTILSEKQGRGGSNVYRLVTEPEPSSAGSFLSPETPIGEPESRKVSTEEIRASSELSVPESRKVNPLVYMDFSQDAPIEYEEGEI
jgi:hypothetical protein